MKPHPFSIVVNSTCEVRGRLISFIIDNVWTGDPATSAGALGFCPSILGVNWKSAGDDAVEFGFGVSLLLCERKTGY